MRDIILIIIPLYAISPVNLHLKSVKGGIFARKYVYIICIWSEFFFLYNRPDICMEEK